MHCMVANHRMHGATAVLSSGADVNCVLRVSCSRHAPRIVRRHRNITLSVCCASRRPTSLDIAIDILGSRTSLAARTRSGVRATRHFILRVDGNCMTWR